MVEISTGVTAGVLSLQQGRAWQARLARTRRRRAGRSGRAPFVSMMQAADLRDRHDGAIPGR
jgi:hypothetical protein